MSLNRERMQYQIYLTKTVCRMPLENLTIILRLKMQKKKRSRKKEKVKKKKEKERKEKRKKNVKQ